ncbi:hypothetical protein BN1708_018059, partial [Verticillium longisporum]
EQLRDVPVEDSRRGCQEVEGSAEGRGCRRRGAASFRHQHLQFPQGCRQHSTAHGSKQPEQHGSL